MNMNIYESANAAFGADYFRTKPYVTYFQFQFPLWSAFMTSPTERERSNFRFSIRILCQRGTSQHTVSTDELRTKALPVS